MKLLSAVVSIAAARRWKRFEAATADPVGAQMKVFYRLIRRAANTQWGREVKLAEIRTVEQFRRRIAVTRYEQAAPLWHKAFEGARDVTWPGHVRYFALSGGTTAGNKALPVTSDAIASNRRAGGLLAAILARRGGAAALLAGKFMYLGGPTTLTERGPCLCGDASGIMSRRIPFFVRPRHLPEPDVAAVTDWEEKVSLVVQRYLTANVGLLGTLPSWAVLLFRQMRQAAEQRGLPQRDVSELWPRLAHFVSYGMAFEPYRNAFQEYVKRDIHYTDTYSSSEGGMTAIQVEAGGPMRLIVDNGVFFEFVPADQADQADPPRLHIGEVSTGVDYAVMLSTNGGIWAYPLGDLVRFESLRPPRIVFAGRTQVQLSAFGEHVPGGLIEKAVAAACKATAAIVADYTVWPRFPSSDQPTPAHRWIVEFDRPPDDSERFVTMLDETIRVENEDYNVHRMNDYGLEGPVLMPVAAGTFYEYMKREGRLGGQNKVPRVVRSDEMGRDLVAISETM